MSMTILLKEKNCLYFWWGWFNRGSMLCKSLFTSGVKSIVVIENSEYALFNLQNEISRLHLKRVSSNVTIKYVLGSVTDEKTLTKLFETNDIDIVFHAAAYKHVPILEHNEIEGCKNNINGTKALLRTAQEFRVKNFVLISTDKAVRSTSIMGASKRVCELMCLSAAQKKGRLQKICIVRFGNVLGSSGSGDTRI